MRYRLMQIACIFFVAVLFTSCVDTRKLVYFPDQRDTALIAVALPPEPIIQANDILSITVTSLNPEASATFNAPNMQIGAGGGALGSQAGYLVSTDGYILFPVLGRVKASGLTKPKLSEYLTQNLLARKQLLDPIVTIRQLNYHITVVGEVGNPGVINIPSEKINLIEALGQAGDLTLYANRKNVVLIREENGQRIFRRIDLNSSNILTSPYYYLKSNDIVYAEPNKIRATSASNQAQVISYGLTAFNTLLTLFLLFFR